MDAVKTDKKLLFCRRAGFDASRVSHSLGMFGRDARLAVPALVELLNDPDADVRGSATNPVKTIDPEAAAKAGVR